MNPKPKIKRGPFFFRRRKEKNPAANVKDLGVGMIWAGFPFYAKLYWLDRTAGLVDKFGFEDVVVDARDVRVNFQYPGGLCCKSKAGTFLPLSHFLTALYLGRIANRNPFKMLKKLDKVLPPDRRVTLKDIQHYCRTGGKGPPLPPPRQAKRIEIDALVKLASEVLSHRRNLKTTFASAGRRNALNDILRVGTSAGGARAKAVIAWNRETNEVRSGRITAGEGFDYWLLKFDGVTGNKDKELEDPKGYGAIEYAYYLMAKAAGVTMSECRLLEEGGRRHFMTRRFD